MARSFNYYFGQRIIRAIDYFYPSTIKLVDAIYPPLKKIITPQLFRYGIVGVFNVLFDWVLFFVLYNFIFKKSVVDFGFIAFTPYIASFIVSFAVTFLSGFWLARYVSFSESNLRGRIQIVRYLMVVITCVLINYFGLKLLVGVFHWYPTPSKMVLTGITTIVSYFSQTYFSFKTNR